MARLVTSAMNQAGTWQDEPQDQADRLSYQSHQQNRQDDWRKQLAFAQLAQNQNQFDQGVASRSDEFNKNYAMQDSLAAAQINDRTNDRKDSADRFGKQFDYMGGRDKLNDDYRNKSFEQENDRYKQDRTDAQPYREAAARRMLSQEELDKQQSELFGLDLEDRKAEAERRRQAKKNTEGLPPASQGVVPTDVSNEYQRNLAEMTPAEASRIRDARIKEKSAASADLAKSELTNSAANFNDRAGEWFDWTGRNTSSDGERVRGLYDAYKSALVKSGVGEADADRMARTAIDPILKNDPLIGSGVNSLRQALGLPGVK